MEDVLFAGVGFVRHAWLSLSLAFLFLVTVWKASRKENAGLSFSQRFIRLCFGFARVAHGFACAVDGAFVAYRQGKIEYAGQPVNERLYPPKPVPETTRRLIHDPLPFPGKI